MSELRKLPFVLALAALLVAVALEVGAALAGAEPATIAQLEELVRAGPPEETDRARISARAAELRDRAEGQSPPGLGIPYLALVDVLLAIALAFIGASTVLPEQLYPRVQPAGTALGALVVVLAALTLGLAAFAALLGMVGLFIAAPFGTLVYLAVFGHFARTAASALLGLVLALKLTSGVALFVASPRFATNKTLVALFATSIGLTLVVSLLHGVVPSFLVSITDAIGALVGAIAAIVWGVVLFLGALPGVVKSLRVRTS